jgi:hypothetical protein
VQAFAETDCRGEGLLGLRVIGGGEIHFRSPAGYDPLLAYEIRAA